MASTVLSTFRNYRPCFDAEITLRQVEYKSSCCCTFWKIACCEEAGLDDNGTRAGTVMISISDGDYVPTVVAKIIQAIDKKFPGQFENYRYRLVCGRHAVTHNYHDRFATDGYVLRLGDINSSRMIMELFQEP